MKYTVVNAPVADRQLADIWLKAADRESVSDAFHRIESSLKFDAHLQGRQHSSGWRVLTAPPLTVAFRVSEDDRLVRILSVALRSQGA
jgi:hypothetical protein